MGKYRGPDDLDDAARARLRRELLSKVRRPETTLGNRAYSFFSVLAAPAPHLVRVLVSLAIVTSVVATATVASADALPDDALYGLKVASEQLRLVLVASPEDRAAVELSIADNRLAEAERLALAGRGSDAVAASSAYGAHLANAAAALAGIEQTDPRSIAVIEQLQSRLAAQQRSAEDTATRVIGDSDSSAALSVLSSRAPSASAGSVAEGIAAHAAAIASQAAVLAQRAVKSEPPPARPAIGAPRVSPSAEAARDGSKKDDTKKEDARPSTVPAAAPAATAARPEPARAAEAARQVLERAQQDAARAQDAAEKAKQAAKDAKDSKDKKGGAPAPKR